MMTKIVVFLSAQERQALEALAVSDMRPMRDQVRYIVRQELERAGFLSTEPNHAREVAHAASAGAS